MKTELIKLSSIKSNPNNPRIIKDDKFKKLVKSIQDFPKMLEIRPIVINDDNIILGGNMRLRACKEAGLKEVPVIKASELTQDEQRQFIIKDNVGFGEWDWDMLANDWENEELNDWGLDVWQNHEINNLDEENLDLNEEFDPIGISSGIQKVTFIFDGPEEAESYLKSINQVATKHGVGWQVNLSTQFT